MLINNILYPEKLPDGVTLDTLEDSVNFYREQTDISLPLKSHVIVMIDGKKFSTKIKNMFDLPFDNDFVNMMNETAVYLCKHVQNVKMAFCQSDEISLYD